MNYDFIIFVCENKSFYNSYWLIKTDKDIFKNISNIKELQEKAYKYILNGNINFKSIVDIIDNKTIKFVRISASEYVYGKQSRLLSNVQCNNDYYSKKMRIVPSIDDLINNASIYYHSPLKHDSKIFINGFNNYQGFLVIDDCLFRYIVRIGNAKNDNLFYDINLHFIKKEIEQIVPHT